MDWDTVSLVTVVTTNAAGYRIVLTQNYRCGWEGAAGGGHYRWANFNRADDVVEANGTCYGACDGKVTLATAMKRLSEFERELEQTERHARQDAEQHAVNARARYAGDGGTAGGECGRGAEGISGAL